MTVRITETSWDGPDVRRLTAEQHRELRARYDAAGSFFYERIL